jgi:EAL domain-containing protein (putative c-di-GMP-specific phosphodiesterase class I)
MANVDAARRTMAELKSMGVGLSLDDFGTGYASLSYISRFPLDRIKIDRSFVKDAGIVGSASALVGAILAMAGSLGMKTIAEGVETEVQRSFLSEKGCDELQGFLFSHAIPASGFTGLMTAESLG